MRSAIIRCAGGLTEGDIPSKHLIDTTLKKFLKKMGWKIISSAFINGMSCLLLVQGSSKTELEELIVEFVDLIKNGWHETGPNHQKLLEMFPEIKTMSNVETYTFFSPLSGNISVELLADSTETDSQIFAQITLRAQLEATDNKVRKVKDSLKSIGDMFKP